MRRSLLHFLLAVLFTLLLPEGIQAQEFIHPGLLHSQKDFERIKAQISEGNPTITQAWKKFQENYMLSKTDQWGPFEVIKRGIAGDENFASAQRDAGMAYVNALAYKISGDPKYAARTVQLLMSYVKVCKAIGGNSNLSLASGIIGYQFANAGELIREYNGWPEGGFRSFQQWMVDVFFCAAQDFLFRHHGTCDSHYQSNWGAANILTVISIGILCDDPAIYNYGMWYLKQGPGNESLNPSICGHGGGLIPYFYEDPRGPMGYLNQMQESTRDQPHCMGALALTMHSCETAWVQGDNTYCNIRSMQGGGRWMLPGAAEYVAAWNSYEEGNETDSLEMKAFPNKSWQGCDAYQEAISYSGRGQLSPMWQMIVNHYENRMGIQMTSSKQMKEKVGLEWGAGDGSRQGFNDFSGFGDLMHNETPATLIPTVLSPRITYKGTHSEYAEISKIEKGSTLTLQALLPEEENNTGNWKWDNGETNAVRTLTADSSALYRVTYTNAKGAKSTQVFSIAVYGDCMRSSVIPSFTYNGITTNDTLITIPKGANLKLIAEAKAWNYDNDIKWNNGATSSSIELTNIRTARTYSVAVTNPNGGVTKLNFHIDLTEIASYMQYDGVTSSNSSANVFEGANIKLWAVPVTSAVGGTFKWSDGSDKDTLTLNKIQESGTYTLIYTSPAGKESKTSWQINVTNKNKLTNGDYYFMNAETGLYYTNPCKDYTTNNSEVMTFEALNEENPDTQIWNFSFETAGKRYKITSKKDGRYLNEHGVLRNRAYLPEWNTYEVYHFTGTDTYAFQNGGSSGSDFWILNNQNGITGKGSPSMNGFPFILIPVNDDSALQNPETIQVPCWQNEATDEITLITPAKGTFCIIAMSGTILKQFNCEEGYNCFPMTELKQGTYIGILKTAQGKISLKIMKR